VRVATTRLEHVNHGNLLLLRCKDK